jgi:drug/metabolite transporter (DMT)-like permease
MFSILIWAGWTVVSRYGVKGVFTSYDITAMRFTVAGLLMLPIIMKKGLRIGPWGMKSALLLSVLIGACYTNIVIAGMKFAPVSHASTINTSTFLIIITVFGIHGLREHVSKTRLVGVCLSLVGIAIMLVAKDAGSGKEWIGHVCFIIGGVMWAVYVLLVRAWKADAIHAAAIVCVFSMLTYMPFYLLFADHHIELSNWHEVALQLGYQGVLTGVVALISFNHGVHILGAARAGAFVPLIPALSTLLAIPTLGEIPSLIEVVGITTVSVGVLLSSGAVRWRP